MSQAPNNFRVTNVDNDPSKLVQFSWDTYVAQTGFSLNSINDLLNSAVQLLTVREAAMVGWRLFRSTDQFFEPLGSSAGDGNCVLDETTLLPGTLSCTDNQVPAYGKFYYKLAAVFAADGGYGIVGYGNGNYGV